MPSNLTHSLATLKAVCENATQGPWRASANHPSQSDDNYGDWSVDSVAGESDIVAQDQRRLRLPEMRSHDTISDNFYTKADAVFSAHARTALPALIRVIETLAEAMERTNCACMGGGPCRRCAAIAAAEAMMKEITQ